ncbi:hypothetical protein BD324DRAFT_583214 [Kockovaella imperatae]|uniref:Glycosyl transferase CAP10 domain-containing protein n=1 Tax=Kockovaella imperatae TaxID=4999 RepID=A0A1Y1UB63_9TREE|nr:hypothetical protein BD324DRAFT_583214 [Kockovaella imperatae]ORX34757.1 hypothetical protein BD324DRAFT_583214 [Kockovaella imperatae]
MRARVATLAAAALGLFLLLQLVSPHSNQIFSHTQRWTTASSSMIRSKFLRAKARAPRPPIHHPIPDLMEEARTKYIEKINRQSATVEDAVKEYRRRYNKNPPKGFDKWYQFAKDHDAVIFDEYDQLDRDLKPFWLFSGAELRRRCIQVGFLPSVDLVRIENGTTRTIDVSKGFDDAEVGARAKGFRVMLEKFQRELPDMDFPINEKAEGRILVPWEENQYSNLTADSSGGIESVLGGEFIPDWRGDGNVWEAYRRTCDPSSQARRLFGSLRAKLKEGQKPISRLADAGVTAGPKGDEFIFAEDVDDKYDFCDHPWAHYNQGHFFSDWRTIHALYPMFSPAKGVGYSDILIPSHYYFSSTKRYTYGWDPVNMKIHDVDDMETDWDDKSTDIFWRGATTGGGSSPPGFLAQYQRHRLIKMTSDMSDAEKTVVFADPPGSTNFISASIPIAELNADMMDVAFTKAVGCTQYPGGCDGMRKDHRFADAVPLGENWRHKYLIDIDGMGYSARLFALLKSESAVLKSTVYTEFCSEWLQPWLHYIPVTQLYNEIYNIFAFFSGPTRSMIEAANATRGTYQSAGLLSGHLDGDAELRKIASAGREWMFSVGRKIDMEIYVYRLCIEWARLVADDREAMTYGN